MSIIEAVRKYLQTCPLLNGGTLNVDFLPPEAATYSVDVVPVKPVLKAYMDGSSQRQFLFVLATRTYYGEFVRQQLDTPAQQRAHDDADQRGQQPRHMHLIDGDDHGVRADHDDICLCQDRTHNFFAFLEFYDSVQL